MQRLILPSFITVTVFLIASLSGCEKRQLSDQGTKFSVYVVNYPLYYFASRIGGDEIAVFFPVPKDVDPAEWLPEDSVIKAYQGADLIVLNGADYAKWTRFAVLPEAKIVDSAVHIRDRFIQEQALVIHSHGPDGAHTHGGIAFTLWLDPALAIEQARSISAALSAALPQRATLFQQRFMQLREDLLQLDAALSAAIGDNAGRPVLVSHPVYQYLEARYGLNALSFHWEPDEMPEPEDWQHLVQVLQAHPAKWMIWEDEPLPEVVLRLQAYGVASVVFNPTAQAPEEGDFLSAMLENAQNLKRIYD
jgi:zinc transport system substrate-binding protein